MITKPTNGKELRRTYFTILTNLASNDKLGEYNQYPGSWLSEANNLLGCDYGDFGTLFGEIWPILAEMDEFPNDQQNIVPRDCLENFFEYIMCHIFESFGVITKSSNELSLDHLHALEKLLERQ